jgi:hypothetical protein
MEEISSEKLNSIFALLWKESVLTEELLEKSSSADCPLHIGLYL